jgi:hypothetical protein
MEPASIGMDISPRSSMDELVVISASSRAVTTEADFMIYGRVPVRNVSSKFRTPRSSANAVHLVSIVAFVSGGAQTNRATR